MFCWKCGKELSKDTRFCIYCGTPAANAESNLPQPSTAEATADKSAQTDDSLQDNRAPLTTDSIPTDNGLEAAKALTPAADLVVRKKRITVTGDKLLITGMYYRRRGRRFNKKKGQLGIPLSFITATSVQHTPYTGRLIISLLLLAIFTAGTTVSGYFGWQARNQINTPYRQERIQELENTLDQLASSDASQLDELKSQIQTADQELTLMNEQLEELQEQRRQELLLAAVANPSFDTGALLATDFFADAYQQYLADLLEAFLNDNLIHDWLYPYYAYSMDLGSNRYIRNELYFYTTDDYRSIFSAETENPETLLRDTYNYDLDQHLYYTGRIYITASDFLNRVLYVPDYVANAAVFVKAYGGNPNPADMRVPGWSDADYTKFWRDARSFRDSSDPFWISYNMSAEDFRIDWGQLVNEQAFYDAYLKFMDTIAPGLGVFDMVTYSAGDDSYGGMYYEITGREASVTEIVTCYIEEHPEYLEELGLEPAEQPSSYDQQIAALEKDIEDLNDRVAELTDEQSELAAFFDSADSVQAEYDQITADAQSRRTRLVRNLAIFASIFALLFLMTLISIIVFIRVARKPKHLMILELTDGSGAAFSISFCSKKKLSELQNRLPQSSGKPTPVIT